MPLKTLQLMDMLDMEATNLLVDITKEIMEVKATELSNSKADMMLVTLRMQATNPIMVLVGVNDYD